MRIEDLKKVYEVESLSFKEPYPLFLLYTFYWISPDLFFVAEKRDTGDIIGYIIGVIRKSFLGHIVSLAVHPKHRRRGVATSLMKRLEGEFIKRGVKALRLEVRVSNTVAREFYLKCGFLESYIIPGYYGDGEACVVMYKRVA